MESEPNVTNPFLLPLALSYIPAGGPLYLSESRGPGGAWPVLGTGEPKAAED